MTDRQDEPDRAEMIRGDLIRGDSDRAAADAPRRILVTGASGFVGAHLYATLSARRAASDTILVPASIGGPDFDLRDAAATDAAVAAARPDVVIHLAAQSSVRRSADDSGDAFAVNLGGSLNLALAVGRHAPEATLLFASSSEVYGATFLDGPATEVSPLRPMNAYARSKRLAEEMFAAVLPSSARLIMARPFNHTGPGQREDFVLPSFAGQLARIESGRQPPRLTVGNIDVARDFLDVRDVVEAYLALVDAAPRLPHRLVCNIATGDAVPLRRHIETLRELSPAAFEIVVDRALLRRADVPVAVGDATLLHGLTGWVPRRTMRDTLHDLLVAARGDLAAGRGRRETAGAARDSIDAPSPQAIGR